MFYIEEIKTDNAAGLLSTCGLSVPQGVDYTAGLFSESAGKERLAACGSLKGDMIQGVAVDPEFQGEDLTGKLMTHLIEKGRQKGHDSLYLFTKAEKAPQFTGLGFRLVAKARPYAALLEWGNESVAGYMKNLKEIRERTAAEAGEGFGALVMNCNPFTLGHRYLIEYAASRKKHVYILAVEEDLSLFSFEDRFNMLRRGTADLKNVTVIPGGRYTVSTLTFPSYFTREENLAGAHAAMDCELFATCAAPPLSVNERFLGTEPVSEVTAVYNETLKKRLPGHGITVTEIPRLEEEGQVISASRVRKILRELWEQEGTLEVFERRTASCRLSELKRLLPESTLSYLQLSEVRRRLENRFAQNGLKDPVKEEERL